MNSLNISNISSRSLKVLILRRLTTSLPILIYAKLNWSRMNRWLKVGTLSDEIKETLSKVDTVQHWVVITEPWCGDAAHIAPLFPADHALESAD